MTIHREGIKIVITELIVLLTIFAVSILFIHHFWINVLLALLFFFLLSFTLWFFRIPKRPLPPEDNKIISPADGKIVVIEKTTEKEYFKDDRIQISIFMSPLNIHQNVYPVSGGVTYTKYHKGKYLVAWHPKSSTENERATVVVKNSSGIEILFRQIAGAMARRICCYAKAGDVAVKGNEFGFIKFGSRVDVFLPADAKVLCSIGDICKNKETILAELR
jgi:phosphatidylserine decarboxylase